MARPPEGDGFQLQTGALSRPKFEGQAFNFGDAQTDVLMRAHVGLRDRVGDLSDTVAGHEKAIATHEGALRGFQSAISAVQSSLAAKIALISAVAAILAGLGWFNLTRTNSVGDSVRDQSRQLGALEVRAGKVENGIQAVNDRLGLLPQQVAQELRQQQAAAKKP